MAFCISALGGKTEDEFNEMVAEKDTATAEMVAQMTGEKSAMEQELNQNIADIENRAQLIEVARQAADHSAKIRKLQTTIQKQMISSKRAQAAGLQHNLDDANKCIQELNCVIKDQNNEKAALGKKVRNETQNEFSHPLPRRSHPPNSLPWC